MLVATGEQVLTRLGRDHAIPDYADRIDSRTASIVGAKRRGKPWRCTKPEPAGIAHGREQSGSCQGAVGRDRDCEAVAVVRGAGGGSAAAGGGV
jgi:hypothetical protein